MRALLAFTMIIVSACAGPQPAIFPGLTTQPAQEVASSPVALPSGNIVADGVELDDEELTLWNRLTPEAQAEAARFIRSGSTLKSALGDESIAGLLAK